MDSAPAPHAPHKIWPTWTAARRLSRRGRKVHDHEHEGTIRGQAGGRLREWVKGEGGCARRDRDKCSKLYYSPARVRSVELPLRYCLEYL